MSENEQQQNEIVQEDSKNDENKTIVENLDKVDEMEATSSQVDDSGDDDATEAIDIAEKDPAEFMEYDTTPYYTSGLGMESYGIRGRFLVSRSTTDLPTDFLVSTYIDFVFNGGTHGLEQAAMKITEAFIRCDDDMLDNLFMAAESMLTTIDESILMILMERIANVYEICQKRSQNVLEMANTRLTSHVIDAVAISPKVQNAVVSVLNQLFEEELLTTHSLQDVVVPFLFDFLRNRQNYTFNNKDGDEYYINSRSTAAQILTRCALRMHRFFSNDWIYENFIGQFSILFNDDSVAIRRCAITSMGTFALAFGQQFTEKCLIPHLIYLYNDKNERIKKAVIDILPDISKCCSSKYRREVIVDLYHDLATDPKKLVSSYALQKLGQMIVTFAHPRVNGGLVYMDEQIIKMSPDEIRRHRHDEKLLEREKNSKYCIPPNFHFPNEHDKTMTSEISTMSDNAQTLIISSNMDDYDTLNMSLNEIDVEMNDEQPKNEENIQENGKTSTEEEIVSPINYWSFDVELNNDDLEKYAARSKQSQNTSVAANDAVLSSVVCDLSTAGLSTSPEDSTKSMNNALDIDTNATSFWQRKVDSLRDSVTGLVKKAVSPKNLKLSTSPLSSPVQTFSLSPRTSTSLSSLSLSSSSSTKSAPMASEEEDDLSDEERIPNSTEDIEFDIADVGPGQISPVSSKMLDSSLFSSRSSLPSPRNSSSSETKNISDLSKMNPNQRRKFLIDLHLSDAERKMVRKLKQKIIPETLYSMLLELSAPDHDSYDVVKEVAKSMPAILFTFGKKNWLFIKSIYKTFAASYSAYIRLMLAKSLHEIAALLDSETVDQDLVPIFTSFINDDAEVHLAMLQNMSDFFKGTSSQIRSYLLSNLNSYLKVDGNRCWRLREEFADQCLKLCPLYSRQQINDGIICFALMFMDDRYDCVRQKGARLLAEILSSFIDAEWPNNLRDSTTTTDMKQEDVLKQMYLTSSLLHDARKSFLTTMLWRRRQTWASLLHYLITYDNVKFPWFSSLFLNDMKGLATDKIANTRLKFLQIWQELNKIKKERKTFKQTCPEVYEEIYNLIAELAAFDTDFEVQTQSKIILGAIHPETDQLDYKYYFQKVIDRESAISVV